MAIDLGTSSTTDSQDSLWSRYRLPLWMNDQNMVWTGVLLTIFAATLYLTTNHIHFFEPQLLTMSWIDQQVPFVPETIWIYMSEYFLFVSAYLMAGNHTIRNKYVWSFLLLQTVSCFIFVFWPTTFPRDQFPLDPEAMDAASYWLFSMLRTADNPASCAPSLHVSSCYLSSFIFLDRREDRKKFWLFFLWATVVGFTTLTTKQHYIIDVYLALVVVVPIYWLIHHKVQFRLMPGAQEN